MIGWIRDLPEWATGAVAAGALWFGVSYAVLAPRAMEQVARAEITPSCVAQLEAEQNKAIAAAKSEFADKQRRARAEYQRSSAQLSYLRQMNGIMNESGVATLMRGFGVPSGPSDADLGAIRSQLDQAKRVLEIQPDFSSMRLPSSELAKTCTCAAMEAIGSSRTSYALALASFRLFTPDDLSQGARRVMSFAGTGQCGGKPWKGMS